MSVGVRVNVGVNELGGVRVNKWVGMGVRVSVEVDISVGGDASEGYGCGGVSACRNEERKGGRGEGECISSGRDNDVFSRVNGLNVPV